MTHIPRPTRLWLLGLSAAIAVLAGCGGGGSSGGSSGGGVAAADCSESARKQFVLASSREWYLFPDLLPASINVGSYAKAEDLLDALTATAREQGKDRYFSYLTTQAEDNSVLGEGQFNGFGFRNRTETGNRPFVLDVFENSPAAEAGLLRGDEIVAVDQGNGFVAIGELLANGATLSDVLGPADVNVRRGLRLLRDGVTRDVVMVKRTVTIDPVPDSFGVRTFALAGTPGVGYVHLRSYISTADTQLGAALAQFRSAGIQDFIIDLRYNGGGLVDTARVLNDLLGGARSSADVQFRVIHNSAKSSRNETTTFQPTLQSVSPVRIAFLTTDGTASASEININSMKPWLETAIVGSNTYGKPVGQLPFDLKGCPDRLRLVSFKTVNKLDEGDYYNGLASSMRFACAADDTLTAPLGDPTDNLTREALDWLRTGSCNALMAQSVAGAAKPGFARPDRYPLGRNPSAAQRWLPGIE
jgi:C-terminal processing protease CtpA/Prc